MNNTSAIHESGNNGSGSPSMYVATGDETPPVVTAPEPSDHAACTPGAAKTRIAVSRALERSGDAARASDVARAFDRDYHFMLIEIDGDELHFQAITRTGRTIDAGTLYKRAA